MARPRIEEPEGLYNLKDILDYHVNRYLDKGVDREELYQQAYLGYLMALKNYDASRGKMTLLYASKFITGSLYHFIRKETKVSWNKEELTDNYTVEDEPNLRSPKEIKFHTTNIMSLVHLLPEKESAILYEYYLSPKPKTLREIAKQFGVSKTRIAFLKCKALNTIRDMLGMEYIETNKEEN